jgi:hypothetical protein
MTHPQPKGFIALISVIIISGLLMLLALGASNSLFKGRLAQQEREAKVQSEELAQSCVQDLLLEYVNSNCAVQHIATSGSQKTYTIQAIFNNAYTNLVATIDTKTFKIVSQTEVANI